MFHLIHLIRFLGLDWDQRTKTKGIYRIVSDKHKGWSLFVDKEFGNYDYLLGIDVRSFRRLSYAARSTEV